MKPRISSSDKRDDMPAGFLRFGITLYYTIYYNSPPRPVPAVPFIEPPVVGVVMIQPWTMKHRCSRCDFNFIVESGKIRRGGESLDSIVSKMVRRTRRDKFSDLKVWDVV